jgi:hypothetical protein
MDKVNKLNIDIEKLKNENAKLKEKLKECKQYDKKPKDLSEYFMNEVFSSLSDLNNKMK